MTALQIMAWIVIVFALVKMLIVLTNPKIWMEKVVRPIFGCPYSQWIFLLIGLVGIVLVSPLIDAAQFFASIFILMFLIAATIVPYSKHLLPYMEKVIKHKSIIWKKSWPVIIVWFGLLAWAIYSLIK